MPLVVQLLVADLPASSLSPILLSAAPVHDSVSSPSQYHRWPLTHQVAHPPSWEGVMMEGVLWRESQPNSLVNQATLGIFSPAISALAGIKRCLHVSPWGKPHCLPIISIQSHDLPTPDFPEEIPRFFILSPFKSNLSSRPADSFPDSPQTVTSPSIS